jgi:hypothetical protein
VRIAAGRSADKTVLRVSLASRCWHMIDDYTPDEGSINPQHFPLRSGSYNLRIESESRNVLL